MTATTTKTKKSAAKQARRVSISKPVNSCYALHLEIAKGKKLEHFGYFLEPLPADFGRAFRFKKFEQEDGEPSEYDVLIDPQGFHACECKGLLRWGHCKHVESILALIQSGKIQ